MNKEDIITIKNLLLDILDDLEEGSLDIHKLNRDLKNVSALVKHQATYENVQLSCEFGRIARKFLKKK